MNTHNYGLIIAPKDPNAFVLGKANELPKIVLQENGQWDEFLPEYEPQAEKFETCGCTIWGTQNAIEMYLKRLKGVEYNYSERFNYILANVSCPGADPHYICESIRDNKVIEQSRLPMVATLQDFLMPRPMSVDYLLEAEKWPFEFQHEWVVQGDDIGWMEKMIEALQYSPLAVAVYAWERNANGLYIRPPRGQDVHWCVIYGYELGKYWKCFDSYDHSIKMLDWNFGFHFVKRFYITDKKPVTPTIKNYWFVDIIKRIFKALW